MTKFTRAAGTSRPADAHLHRGRAKALACPLALALALAAPGGALAVSPATDQPVVAPAEVAPAVTAPAVTAPATWRDLVDPAPDAVDPAAPPAPAGEVPPDSSPLEEEPTAPADDEQQGILGTYFSGTFETGYSPWTMVQEENSDRVRTVTSPVRQGKYASRHEVRDGDYTAGGARSEVLWGRGDSPTLKSGYDRWFGWSTYFPGSFYSPPYGNGQHSVFLQWKQSSRGEPPLRMSSEGERIRLKVPGGELWSTTLRRGAWHSFVAHVRFSSDPDIGRVELWHNGSKVMAGRNVRTLASGQGSYVKLGYYRHEDIRPTAALYHDAFRVGTSYGSVSPG